MSWKSVTLYSAASLPLLRSPDFPKGNRILPSTGGESFSYRHGSAVIPDQGMTGLNAKIELE